MLLQRLVEYADRQADLTPPLYTMEWVRYVVELDKSGELLNPQPVDLSEQNSKRGQRRPVPNVQRTVAIKPLLLADNAEYTFGLAREKSQPERVENCHAAYVALLEECVTETADPFAAAVLSFLHSDPVSQLDLPEDFDRSEKIIFRIKDVFPHRQPAVQQFWARHNAPKTTGADATLEMQCIVCGEEKPVVKRLRGKVKGIPGGQPSGTAVISANKPAFESYGLEASHIAPICLECGDRFTKAINHLLRDDSSHVWFSSLLFAFWTREDVGFNVAGWLKDPEPQDVRDLVEGVRTGRTAADVDETAFYGVSLSGSGGRAVVRDWIDTTVGQAKSSLANWFQRQQIVDAWGDEHRPLGIYALAGATVRDLKDLPPPTIRALLAAALTDTPLPWDLLAQAVRRNCAERDVTRPRAALIKLVLTSQYKRRESNMVQLQTDHPEPAYHCGRLLAVLEQTQRAAIGSNISATIVDRFYGTASTAPASVFGRLLRGAQPHLSKLQRDRPGAAYAIQERMEEIMAALPAFPRTLDLKQQGLFALGYYHQRAYDRAQARAAKAVADEDASGSQ
jgi:CRISPR-associated protein Csd1